MLIFSPELREGCENKIKNTTYLIKVNWKNQNRSIKKIFIIILKIIQIKFEFLTNINT